MNGAGGWHRIEAEALRELALTAGDEPALRRVAAAAGALATRATGTGSVRTERELERLALRLRAALLARAHRYSDPHLRSPLGAVRPLPSGALVHFNYERGAGAPALEARLGAAAPPPAGWRADHVVFSSGMAAISAVLQALRSTLRPTAQRPLRLGTWARYYETEILLALTGSDSFISERMSGIDEATASGRFDLLFVEPVRYDWDLTPMDVPGFVRAWRSNPGERARAIVLDTTLAGHRWPTAEFLATLAEDRPPLVVEIRSGLKLDQQGLELANLGIVSVYGPAAGSFIPATGLGDLLRVVRSVAGAAPGMDALAALDVPFVFDPEWSRRHSEAVFRNNRLLAESAATGGVFQSVGHPALTTSGTVRDAPFVLFRLAEDEPDDHAFIHALFQDTADRVRLPMYHGSSFGFRAHRWESIYPAGGRPGVFKMAMGSRSGPSADAALALMRRISEFPDFTALRRAHPGVRPVAPTAH